MPENVNVVSDRKKIKTPAKSVGRQTLRKYLDICSKKRIESRVIPKKIYKTNQSVAKPHFFKRFSLIMSINFRYQPFEAVSRNVGGKVPVVDAVLSSNKQEIYLTISLDGNCIQF